MNGSSSDRRTQTYPAAHEGLLPAPSAVIGFVTDRVSHYRFLLGEPVPSFSRIIYTTALI